MQIISTVHQIQIAPPVRRSRRKNRIARFDPRVRRRREIERHAIEVGAADSDDLSRWLIAWVWHNQQSKAPIDALLNAAHRMGADQMTEAEAEAILEEASLTRRHMSADNLARFLGVTWEQRQRLGLTTIGSVDVKKHDRKVIRQYKDKMAKRARRREQGARPRAEYRANSLSATQPWKAEGVSRSTWERRRRRATATIDASPSTAVFLSTADTLASPAPPPSGRPSDGVSADAAVPVAAAAVTATVAALAATPAVEGLVLSAKNCARLARDVDRGVERRAA